jgi:MFS family permease
MGFSALLPSIMQDLALSYTQAGVLASGFFGAYAAMQLPAGLLGDRFGRRRVLLGAPGRRPGLARHGVRRLPSPRSWLPAW